VEWINSICLMLADIISAQFCTETFKPKLNSTKNHAIYCEPVAWISQNKNNLALAVFKKTQIHISVSIQCYPIDPDAIFSISSGNKYIRKLERHYKWLITQLAKVE
jgi:hypothetical protein